MIFPRETVKVGDCIAIVRKRRSKFGPIGSPMMNNAHIVIDHKGEKTYAHRLSYQLNVEDIPDHPLMLTEGLVLHHCNNKWCIEPTHLYIGNATDRPQPIRRKYRTKKEMEELRHKKRLRLEDLKMRRGKRAR